MKQRLQAYRPLVQPWVKPIRHPGTRLIIALCCGLLAAALGYRLLVVWLQNPSWEPVALTILAIPAVGVVLLSYLVHLLLFAPIDRLQLGILPPLGLFMTGLIIVLVGVWGLTRFVWEAAFLLALGIACISLARDRSQLKRRRRNGW